MFIGQANVVGTGPGSQRTRFRIEESFRGPASGDIEIVSKGIGGSCDFEFKNSSRYVVYAKRTSGGIWLASICSRTALLDDDSVADDLVFARQIVKNPAGPGRVLGSVSIGERDSRGIVIGTGVLPGASVSIRNADHAFTIETDLRGNFEFAVPSGQYTLTLRVPSQFEPAAPATVTVPGAGACVTHSFSVVRRR